MAFGKLFWFLVYLVFGLYLINYSLQFYPVNELFSGMNKYLILVGGILIVWSGINSLFARKFGNSE